MPSRHIWASSEIPPKCKLQRLEKEQCVAEAEKFIAEFYRHKFIKPTPKNYKFNHVVDFQVAFSGSYLRFFAKYACPGSHALSPFFEHPFARLGCFGRDRWNPWGAPAQRRVDLYRAPSSDTPGVLSIHAREPMVSFLNLMRPTAPLRSDDSPVNDIDERRSSYRGSVSCTDIR